MARLYQKIDNEAVPLGGGGGGSVAIDNDTITENSDGEIQVATTLTSKINQLNNVAADMGKVLTANGNGTAEWDDILVPIDYETITKNGNGELQVSSVPYDNTESGLTADNVQDAIDEVSSDLTASDGLNFRFATDGEGNYGYLKADDSFVPFKSGGDVPTGLDTGDYLIDWWRSTTQTSSRFNVLDFIRAQYNNRFYNTVNLTIGSLIFTMSSNAGYFKVDAKLVGTEVKIYRLEVGGLELKNTIVTTAANQTIYNNNATTDYGIMVVKEPK